MTACLIIAAGLIPRAAQHSAQPVEPVHLPLHIFGFGNAVGVEDHAVAWLFAKKDCKGISDFA